MTDSDKPTVAVGADQTNGPIALVRKWWDQLKDISNEPPPQWISVEGIQDPGFGVAGHEIREDECYIDIYAESFRLKYGRRLVTKFEPVVYVFAKLAQEGRGAASLAAVSKPENLAGLDPTGLPRVIAFETHLLGPTPWRGGRLDLQLGLFSVKSGDLMTPILNFVTKVAEAGSLPFIAPAKPFLALIPEGMDLLAGQTQECAVEVAIDRDMPLSSSVICAVVGSEFGAFDSNRLTLNKNQRVLLLDGEPLDAAYCVFSIRSLKRRVDWADIPNLQEAWIRLTSELRPQEEDSRPRAEKAYEAFRREAQLSPDLIQSDRDHLAAKAKGMFDRIYSGVKPISREGDTVDPTALKLRDLNLYDE